MENHKCIVCGIEWSEESGAYEGFTCDDCLADERLEVESEVRALVSKAMDLCDKNEIDFFNLISDMEG